MAFGPKELYIAVGVGSDYYVTNLDIKDFSLRIHVRTKLPEMCLIGH